MGRGWPRAVGCLLLSLVAATALAQSGGVSGVVRDETGGVLPGVTVQARDSAGGAVATVTDAGGRYQLERLAPGSYQLSFSLINFGSAPRVVDVHSIPIAVDAVLQYTFSADVTVSGKTTFVNLADVESPAESLVGVAQSASQGAISARQLDARPIMRVGEVLETVPGVVISQHSGAGKANQYYLRGFNLDHGTDFATHVAGMPVNMPTHGHGHGYSDLNFLIPELVSGIQFSKGPYFADQGDFSTAGSASINYVNVLPRTLVRVGGGGQGYARALAATSPRVGEGTALLALDVEHNDGPWEMSDDYQKINGVVRYTRGDGQNGFSLTGMGYRGTWRSTDQVPRRAIESGRIGRFSALDQSGGGDTYRYSGSLEWQRSRGSTSTRVVGYGIGYDMNLYSNFTFFLDDPENGDQFHQADHRFVTGARVSHRRLGRMGTVDMQNTVGVQVRNDRISPVGLYHTVGRERLETTREDRVIQTSGGGYAQNEAVWTPWLRTLAGIRIDAYRFDVRAGEPANGGVVGSGIVSPKGGAVLGPWNGTELYVNGGFGFHSNDARGATITIDPKTGGNADRVTPLVRAKGAEVGLRTVAVPRLQASATAWTLSLDSELLFVGDAGTTEASRPSYRYGIELATYYTPRPWLMFDSDVTWSSAHFTDADPAGDAVPGAIETVVAAGATVDSLHGVFGSVRLRYFGPRALTEDNSVRSKATSLVNLEGGYTVTPNLRVLVDVFNVFDARASDIDYYYPSRLPGEPADGIDDVHFHPALPRFARVGVVVSF